MTGGAASLSDHSRQGEELPGGSRLVVGGRRAGGSLGRRRGRRLGWRRRLLRPRKDGGSRAVGGRIVGTRWRQVGAERRGTSVVGVTEDSDGSSIEQSGSSCQSSSPGGGPQLMVISRGMTIFGHKRRSTRLADTSLPHGSATDT